jgi:hypothetical protein
MAHLRGEPNVCSSREATVRLVTDTRQGVIGDRPGRLPSREDTAASSRELSHGVAADEEAYFKVDREVPPEQLAALESTFPPMRAGEVLRAAREVVATFRARAPLVASQHGLAYPAALDRLMVERLSSLG